LFKEFILEYRPGLDVAKVATGEVWSGSQALTRGLVDAIDTSDEWLLEKCRDSDVYEIGWEHKRKLTDKLGQWLEGSIAGAVKRALTEALHRAEKEKFFS